MCVKLFLSPVNDGVDNISAVFPEPSMITSIDSTREGMVDQEIEIQRSRPAMLVCRVVLTGLRRSTGGKHSSTRLTNTNAGPTQY
jgi:hypothetical protein